MIWPGKAAGKGPRPRPSPPVPAPGAPKRPAPPAVVPPSNKVARGAAAESAPGGGTSDNTIVVYCTSDKDEIGIRTLVGEYKAEGSNHGRMFYKKTQKIPGHEDINVFLYYWDERDGPSFSGWWFGNQVGGAQVWSRNAQATQKPPKTGWTIPWDGEVKKELVVAPAAENKQASGAAARADAVAKMDARRREEEAKASEESVAAWEERVEQATLKAAEAEVGVQEALEMAKEAMAAEELDDAALAEAQQELASQATALATTQKAISSECLAASRAPPALRAEIVALGTRLRQLQATLKEELGRVRNAKESRVQEAERAEKRAEEEARERELEEGYSKQLEEMLPPAMEKTDAAEEEVEKVAVAAAPLQIDAAEDLRPVMLQAIKETEQRVRAAQASIGEARRFISGKLTQVGRFAPQSKKTAVEEFTALQKRLSEAQEKLNPYKTVRQDYEQRAQAKKLHEELSSKVSGAEIEVEKAAMMVAPLGGDSAEGLKETEAALNSAQSAISQTLRLIDAKFKTTSGGGPLREEIKSLQDRAKIAQEKLDEVRRTMKETQVRVAADQLLREVSDKVSAAEDELQKMAEAELPFLRGDKTQDMEPLIAQADEVAVKVHTSITEAQTFIARKLVEVARFSEGPARAVKEEIDMMTKRLEDGRERLHQFRSSTADRKRAHLLEEVDAKVKAAEDDVVRLAEATRGLGGLGAAGEAPAEGGREAVEQANAAERAAQASLVVARKYLLQKTAELKKLAITGAGSGSELGRLQTRVNNIQQEIVKFRNTTKDAEERLRVKAMVNEVATRLAMTEAEVDKVAAAAVAASKDASDPAPETVERMERATASAQTKLSATAKLVDVKLKAATGFLREELSAMRAKISAAERKLAVVVTSAKEQKDRLLCTEMLAEATLQVENAEAAVAKANDAELPFLKGLESLSPREAIAAVAACEEAASAGQKAVTNARTLVVQKLVDVKELSKGPADACCKEIAALQKRLDTGATKLAELKKETAERKRKTQMQMSGEKVAAVEAAVQKLANTMTKFSDDKLGDISQEQARKTCEEIAGVEGEAQATVADARKFLAMRAQDAKNSTDSNRGTLTADLAKLQARLTQCQVELAKLSKQCTEREQRFVAQKLVHDANANIKQLRQEVEDATTAAQALLADDTSELALVALAQHIAATLVAHLRTKGESAAQLFAAIAGGKSVPVPAFAAWLNGVPELTGDDDTCLAEAHALQVAGLVAARGPQVTKAHFEAFLRERYVCTGEATLWSAAKGGEALGRVEAGEGLELVAEAKPGAERAQFALGRNGQTVWLAAASAKPAPPFVGRVESIEAFVKGVHQRCTEASQSVDQKTVDLAHVKTGPLVEVKAKLQEIRALLGQERAKVDTLKKRVAVARAALAQQRKGELQQLQESRCKEFASKAVATSTAAIEAAEAKAAKVIETAKSGSAEKLQKELSASELERLKGGADEALVGLAEARGVVARAQEAHDSFKGPRSMLLESRVELTKLLSRATTAERKLKAATDAVQAAYAQAARTATLQARAALRAAARKSGKTTDELFDEVSKGGGEISAQQFSAFVQTLPDHGLSAEQVALVFREVGKHGLRKPGFAKALQEFVISERPSDITYDLEPASGVLRRLEKGELFEVLEGPAEAGPLKRVRGRALRDGAIGWVTFKGGDGVLFLKAREKPFLGVAQPTELLQRFDPEAPVVRKLQQDEVLELLEGPRPLEPKTEMCLRCTVGKDGATGWVTLTDADGATFASPNKKLYMCRSTIAMTDSFDISNTKVLRKVDAGEALEVIGGQERTDENMAISRLQFRAVRDGKEGWVTLKGNQGTIYAELSDCHFVADRPLALRAGAARDAEILQQVAAGQMLAGLEPPKEVRPAPRMGARARALEDGKAGWIVFAPGPKAPIKQWKPRYVCKAPVDLTASLALTPDATAVRRAEVGETFNVAEGPALDSVSGKRRLCLATPEDGVVGWATLRAEDGTPFLETA